MTVVADAVLVGPGRQVRWAVRVEARVAVQGVAAVGAGVGQQLGDQEARVVGVADPGDSRSTGVTGKGALGFLQAGDEAVGRDDRARLGQRGRPRPVVRVRLAPAPRPEAGGVWRRVSSAARSVAAHRARARRSAEVVAAGRGGRPGTGSGWSPPGAGPRPPGAARARRGGHQAQEDGATGRSASASSACCSIAVLRLGIPLTGPVDGPVSGQACRSTLNQAITP